MYMYHICLSFKLLIDRLFPLFIVNTAALNGVCISVSLFEFFDICLYMGTDFLYYMMRSEVDVDYDLRSLFTLVFETGSFTVLGAH